MTDIQIDRDHPVVKAKSQAMCLGYDDAETLIRASKDAASVQAAKEIDAARERIRQKAIHLNADMTELLDQGGKVNVPDLVATLAANPQAETWLIRRVQLTRAHEAPPADDFHPVNI